MEKQNDRDKKRMTALAYLGILVAVVGKEYSIPVDDRIREDVSTMCNLSQGIRDNALVDVIMNMYENQFTFDQIAVATKKSVEEVKAIIEKREPVLA